MRKYGKELRRRAVMKTRYVMSIVCLIAVLGLWGCKSENPEEPPETTESILYISTDETSSQGSQPQDPSSSQEDFAQASSLEAAAEDSEQETQETQGEKTTARDKDGDGSGAFEAADMDKELAQVEEQAKKQMEKLQSAVTQMDMNEASDELYQLWDQELNDIWKRLKGTLSEAEMSELTERQREWIAFKEEAGKAAGSECEGGSIQGMIIAQKKAELTRERVYELADGYFGSQASPDALSNQDGSDVLSNQAGSGVLSNQAEGMSQGEKPALEGDSQGTGDGGQDRFSGSYVDTQGTEDIYSSLLLTSQGNGAYEAEIGLYRLTTLEGTAKAEGDTLTFTGQEPKVKGNIRFQDGGAVFTITESEFEYIHPGDVFQFPVKQ